MPCERAIRPNPLTDADSSATPGELRIRDTLRPMFMSNVPLRGQYRAAIRGALPPCAQR